MTGIGGLTGMAVGAGIPGGIPGIMPGGTPPCITGGTPTGIPGGRPGIAAPPMRVPPNPAVRGFTPIRPRGDGVPGV